MSRLCLKTISVIIITVLLTIVTVWGDEKFDNLISTGKYKKAIEYADANIPAKKRDVDIWVKLGLAHEKIKSPKDKIAQCYKEAQKANPSDPRVYLGLGRAAMLNKKYNDALKHYQRSYILKRTAEAAEGIAIAAAKLKNMDKARDAAESAVNLDPNVFESRLILTDIYRRENDFENAAVQLEHIVKKEPTTLKYWKRLALCYEKTGEKDKLAKVDPQIIKLDKKDVKSRRRHAEYSLAKKDQKTAFELYKELAILTPNDPTVFKHLYEISQGKGNKDDAILYLKNYIALDSSKAEYHKELGNLLYAKKDIDGALESYRRAVRTDPKIKGFYKNYETIVLKKGLKKEAIKVIKGAIAAKEADSKSYIALGDIYKSIKQYENAIAMYKETLKTDKKNVAVLTSLAECQAKSKKISEAIITYEQVILLNPKAKMEHKILGDLHMKLKKTDNAMQAYKKYLTKVPTDYEIARTIGLHEHKKKKYTDAIKYLEMVKDVKLHNTAYYTALGESYYNTKKYDKAAESFAKVKERKVSDSVLKRILKPLGESYEKIGDKKKAAEAYSAYTRIPGVKDADASYLKAYLRESTDKTTAIKIYTANIKRFPKDHRNFLRLGLIYAQEKSTLSKASSMLSKASQLVTRNPVIWKNLAEVYGKLKNTEKELYAYKKLLAIEPQNLNANRRVGTILLKKKKYTEAIVNLEMVHTTSPKDVQIMELLAEGYMKTKRPAKAVALLSKAKKLKPDKVEIRISLIEACKAAGKKEMIIKEKAELAELDKKIISRDKKNIDSRVRLADYSYNKKDFKTAYAIYKELSVLTPKEKRVFKRLNEIALKNNNKKEGISYLKKYLTLDTKNAKAHVLLGNLLYEQKDFDGALDSYRTALKLDPKIKGFYQRYGEIVVKKNLEDEAVKVLNATITAGEADNNTYITLGKIYQKKKQYASAIKMYQKASDLNPKNHSVLRSLAECQAKSGNTNAAILTYEQVVLINPGAKNEYKELGDLQMKVKKKSAAIETYKKYLEKAPDDNAVAKTIGLHEYDKKNYKDAVKYLTMVKDKKLHDTKYLTSLGQAYYYLKDYGKAADLFAQVRKRKVSADVLKSILKPLGECYEKTGKNAEAADAYLAYTKLPGTRDADASYKKAFLREKTDQKTAIKMYNANIKVFTKDYRSFLRLGIIYSASKATRSKAASMLSKASLLKPNDASILERLGEVYGKLNKTTNELETYKKLLKLSPQHLEANRRVGLILLKQKKYTESIVSLEIVLTMAPNDVEIMLALAEGYMKTKRPEKAIELLAKAKKIKKNDPDIGSLLYQLYKQTGKEKQAESEIKELIALTKDNKLRIVYAKDLIEQNRLDEAGTLVGEIKKTEPTNVEGLMLLGKIQQAQKKLNEATETYKMISYIKENYAPALCERGNIYLAQSKLSRAESFFEKAIKSDPKMAEAYLGLARVAKAQKKTANYTKYLNKAKALDPDNKEIQNELKKK